MSLDERPTVIEPGSGLVARWPGSVVVACADDPAAAAGLIATLGAGLDGPPGIGRLIERLREHAPAATGLRALAAAIDTGDGIRALALGAGVVAVGEHQVRSAGTLQEVQLDASASHVLVGEADEAAFALSGSDLRLGVVPGRAAKLVGQDHDPLPPPPVADEPAAPPARPFSSIDLRAVEAAQVREPLPILTEPATEPDDDQVEVSGILCSRSHFNNPLAAYCLVCGISMVHLTHNLVKGPRPTLGFVVFDDGNTYALDRSYVIGRDPAEGVDDGHAALVADDPNHTVSRIHAYLDLDQWDVVLRDAGSTNGTFVWNGPANRWDFLQPGTTVILRPGAQVSLGRRTFVYESVHRV